MKSICTKIASIAAIIAATSALADTNTNKMQGYFSTLHPSLNAAPTKAKMFPPTDITVTNSSVAAIHVVVPGTSIHDTLYPMANDHIRNWNGAFSTAVTLEDTYHNVFWSAVVCPRALVNVYGQPGSYRIIVDNEYCL